MQLDKITVVIRPRRSWEALDLGFVMARQWWWLLTKSYVLITLPLFLVLLLLLGSNSWWPLTIIWWLKPLWERSQLYILSRTLFGEWPTVRQTLKAFPALALKQIISSLIWRRLSFTRSMDLPVLQLEGLSGRRRQQRLVVLHSRDADAASWLTIIGVHLENFIGFSLLLLSAWFMPEEIGSDLFVMTGQQSQWHMLMYSAFAYAAICLVAPFYSAAGFALYLNRRIQLEAWDVEVVFRKLLQRQQSKKREFNRPGVTALSFMLCCLLTLSLNSNDSCAGQTEELEPATTESIEVNYDYIELNQADSRKLIDKIFEHPDFNKQKIISLPKFIADLDKEEETEKPSFKGFEKFIRGLAEIFRVLAWAAALFLVLYVIYKFGGWAEQLGLSMGGRRTRKLQPKTLFGLDVREESLPDDIAGAAKVLCEQGHIREALALLYRAMLSILLDRYHVPLRVGHTEGECVSLARRYAPKNYWSYFAELSRVWVAVAYGHRMLQSPVVDGLCERWPLLSEAGADDE